MNDVVLVCAGDDSTSFEDDPTNVAFTSWGRYGEKFLKNSLGKKAQLHVGVDPSNLEPVVASLCSDGLLVLLGHGNEAGEYLDQYGNAVLHSGNLLAVIGFEVYGMYCFSSALGTQHVDRPPSGRCWCGHADEFLLIFHEKTCEPLRGFYECFEIVLESLALRSGRDELLRRWHSSVTHWVMNWMALRCWHPEQNRKIDGFFCVLSLLANASTFEHLLS